ncbi:MAG: AraC family transcriptional regulator [Alloprevotella sp.]|nr:AraC family transcriptional regulator [Prevotella sp.]MBR1712706.1 AraC family transcriptional regulator [Alloprevotella sp.]
MEKILKVHRVGDYARYIGAPELHPLLSVIHYDELQHCRHSLNNYDVYGIFIGDETLENLTYGLHTYDLHRHALMCVAPGQIGGKADTGEEIQTKGWALLFDPELLHGTPLGQRMARYTYFSYNTNEALLMTEEEYATIVSLFQMLRHSATAGPDALLVAHLHLVLEYIAHFYARQLSNAAAVSSDLLTRFENLLERYYADGTYRRLGLPTVKYCARELCLSPNYFGDLIRQQTDDTASNAIRRFLMQRARALLMSGATVSQTAAQLGFDYPQHFTRQFRNFFGLSPTAFLKSHR